MRAPSGPAVGAYVYAKDKKGYWYRAKVLAERGGNPRSYFVHFQGFRSNHDEWVPKARIRLTATKAQIVQLNARVAWMGNTTGLNADENSWVYRRDISCALVGNLSNKKEFPTTTSSSVVADHRETA